MEKIINGKVYRLVRPGVYVLYDENGDEKVRAWSVGEIIADRRDQLKMTQQELADRIGVNRSTLSRYESGTYKKIPYDVMLRLSSALNATEDYLFGKVDDPQAVQFPVSPDEQLEQRLLFFFRRLSGDQKEAVVKMIGLIGGEDDASV